MADPVFHILEGFESGVDGIAPADFPFGADIDGVVETVAGRFADSYAARLWGTNHPSSGGIPGNIDWFLVDDSSSSTSEGCERLYLRLESLPAQRAGILKFSQFFGGALQIYWDPVLQTLSARVTNAAGDAFSEEVGDLQRFGCNIRLDAAFIIEGGQAVFDWAIDSVPQPQVVLNSPGFAGCDFFSAGGEPPGSFDWEGKLIFDDVVATNSYDDYPLGPGRITRLLPDSLGSSVGLSNFKNNDGSAIDASTPGLVDDLPWPPDAAYFDGFFKQIGSDDAAYLELNLSDLDPALGAGESIRGAAVMWSHNKPPASSPQGFGKITVRDGVNAADLVTSEFLNGVGPGPVYFVGDLKKVLIPNPAGGWSEAVANDLRLRFHTGDPFKPYLVSVALVEIERSLPADNLKKEMCPKPIHVWTRH